MDFQVCFIQHLLVESKSATKNYIHCAFIMLLWSVCFAVKFVASLCFSLLIIFQQLVALNPLQTQFFCVQEAKKVSIQLCDIV